MTFTAFSLGGKKQNRFEPSKVSAFAMQSKARRGNLNTVNYENVPQMKLSPDHKSCDDKFQLSDNNINKLKKRLMCITGP